jgi:hypothetical protein
VKEMRRHWLRGVLLGVSVALLFAGGVAVAAVSISMDPWCGVCCDYPIVSGEEEIGQLTPLCDDFWTFTASGWGDSELLYFTLNSPAPRLPITFGTTADENGHRVIGLYLFCARGDQDVQTFGDGFDIAFGFSSDWTEDDYGEWNVVVEGNSRTVETDFYFAEDASDCELEEEFVAEPGSILLLGSGLAGLAGYATLRLGGRKRE